MKHFQSSGAKRMLVKQRVKIAIELVGLAVGSASYFHLGGVSMLRQKLFGFFVVIFCLLFVGGCNRRRRSHPVCQTQLLPYL